jgi:hypothetical protein
MEALPAKLGLYLAVTGGLTLAIAMHPEIIVLGFIAFIIPGLVLSVMPVAFAYGAVFALIRYAAMVWSEKQYGGSTPKFVNIIAVLGTAALGLILPALAQLEADWRLASFNLASVQTDGAPPVQGDVRIELQWYGGCSTQCRTLLLRPGVTSVTAGDLPLESFAALRDGTIDPALKDGARQFTGTTYRLSNDPACRLPDEITDAEAKVCLITGNSPPSYDFLIRQGEWREGQDLWSNWSIRSPVTAKFAEIRSKDRVFARVWQANVDGLSLPLSAFPTCGGTYETILCWSRRQMGEITYNNDPSAMALLNGRTQNESRLKLIP